MMHCPNLECASVIIVSDERLEIEKLPPTMQDQLNLRQWVRDLDNLYAPYESSGKIGCTLMVVHGNVVSGFCQQCNVSPPPIWSDNCNSLSEVDTRSVPFMKSLEHLAHANVVHERCSLCAAAFREFDGPFGGLSTFLHQVHFKTGLDGSNTLVQWVRDNCPEFLLSIGCPLDATFDEVLMSVTCPFAFPVPCLRQNGMRGICPTGFDQAKIVKWNLTYDNQVYRTYAVTAAQMLLDLIRRSLMALQFDPKSLLGLLSDKMIDILEEFAHKYRGIFAIACLCGGLYRHQDIFECRKCNQPDVIIKKIWLFYMLRGDLMGLYKATPEQYEEFVRSKVAFLAFSDLAYLDKVCMPPPLPWFYRSKRLLLHDAKPDLFFDGYGSIKIVTLFTQEQMKSMCSFSEKRYLRMPWAGNKQVPHPYGAKYVEFLLSTASAQVKWTDPRYRVPQGDEVEDDD